MGIEETTDGLASRLRAGTRDLHIRAERSGVMHALLRGQLSRRDYCRLLRNLHAIYVALEAGCDEHAEHPLLAHVHDPALHRASALAADLDHLHGNQWRSKTVLAPSAQDYVQRLAGFARDEPVMLVAHVYVRYLGDLNGGQMLQRIVRESMQLEGSSGTAFYRFSPEPAALLEARLRRGLDAMPLARTQKDALVDESRWAFRAHCELFEQLAETVDHSGSLA